MKYMVIVFAILLSEAGHGVGLEYATSNSISSKTLSAERTFYINLPSSYASDITKTYPVLFVLHGQWDMLAAVATLDLLADEIPEFVIVGIDVRGKELRPGESGDLKSATPFFQFLHRELVPHIRANYRTAPYEILSGHSNSGRFVMNAWMENGDFFSSYYSFSPSLEDGAINDRLQNISSRELEEFSPLTITIANEGEHMQIPFTQLAKRFSRDQENSFNFKRFPDQTHSTSRHASLMYALQTSFFDWNPSHEIKVGGLDGLIGHYHRLSERYGFTAEIPLETLQRLSAYYSVSTEKEDEKNASQVIKYGMNKDTNNADAFMEMADYLKSNNNEPAGKRIMLNVSALAPTYKGC